MRWVANSISWPATSRPTSTTASPATTPSAACATTREPSSLAAASRPRAAGPHVRDHRRCCERLAHAHAVSEPRQVSFAVAPDRRQLPCAPRADPGPAHSRRRTCGARRLGVDILLQTATASAVEIGVRELSEDAPDEWDALTEKVQSASPDELPLIAGLGLELFSGPGPARLACAFEVLANGILTTPRPTERS